MDDEARRFLATRPAYDEYVVEIKRRQAAYIADKLLMKYTADMAALGLHPLDRNEIVDRFSQLRVMESRIDETHGDTPVNWIMYQDHCGP